jgi:hypothetical protein
MDREIITLIMETFTRVNGAMIFVKEMVSFLLRKRMKNIKESGKMGKNMEEEDLNRPMKIFMKGNLWEILSRAEELCIIKMEIFTMDSFTMILNQAKVIQIIL